MPKDLDNLSDHSEKTILFRDGPHRGRYYTHSKVRPWYSIEVGETGSYAYYKMVAEDKVGRGKTKSIIYIYAFQQLDGPDTALANTMRERKRDGKKYDLQKA